MRVGRLIFERIFRKGRIKRIDFHSLVLALRIQLNLDALDSGSYLRFEDLFDKPRC